MQVHLPLYFVPLCIYASVYPCVCASVRLCVRESVHDTQRAHSACQNSVSWGQGNQLASASDGWTVVVWKATSGEQVLTVKGHTQPVNSVAWGKADQLALASDDQTVVVRNFTSGELVSTLKGHTLPVKQRRVGQGRPTRFGLRS